MMAPKGEQSGCPDPGGWRARLAGPQLCQPTAAKHSQPGAKPLGLAQEDGGGGSTLQLQRTVEVAAPDQVENGMCFAVRCGLCPAFCCLSVPSEHGGDRSCGPLLCDPPFLCFWVLS